MHCSFFSYSSDRMWRKSYLGQFGLPIWILLTFIVGLTLALDENVRITVMMSTYALLKILFLVRLSLIRRLRYWCVLSESHYFKHYSDQKTLFLVIVIVQFILLLVDYYIIWTFLELIAFLNFWMTFPQLDPFISSKIIFLCSWHSDCHTIS